MKILFNYTYPVRCPVCGDIAVPAGKKVCDSCRTKPVRVLEPRCKKCSKPLESEEQEYCFDCSQKDFYYERGLALWMYDAAMKKSIGWFKYSRRKEYASYYADELAAHFQNEVRNMKPDVIMPIPIHISRLRQRGFNQAQLVAEELGARLNLPVVSDVLLRTEKTAPQKDLNSEERAENLRHAFTIHPQKIKMCNGYKRILLLDDIYTTGSTINSCARILKSAGVEKVYFLTLCIGRGF